MMSIFASLSLALLIPAISGTPVDSSSPGTCASNQFRCKEGICIPRSWRCDFHKDCLDGSDELDCAGYEKVCPISTMKCDGYRCVFRSNVCDGVPHCTDGADERDCNNQPTGISTASNQANSPSFISSSRFVPRRVPGIAAGFKTANDVKPTQNIFSAPIKALKESGLCPSGQFACRDGTCIIIDWLCDGINDCLDKSDERNCTRDSDLTSAGTTDATSAEDDLATSPSSHSSTFSVSIEKDCGGFFKCLDGTCIPPMWKCDGDIDCKGQEDELGCPEATCQSNEFKCSPGICISKRWVCDGDKDCSDGDDEENCQERTCSEKYFRCLSGQCVYKEFYCNGYTECSDGSDETNCEGSNCPFNENFRCLDGLCIPAIWLCDGDKDCSGGEDERNCSKGDSNSKCGNSSFKCLSGRCVDQSMVCNGHRDCQNGDDEENCVKKNPVTPDASKNEPCDPDNFQCKDGLCIEKAFACDGDNDCNGGEDELNCTTGSKVAPACKNDEFMCLSDSKCIPISLQCNREKNCADLSDEIRCGNRDCFDNEFRCKVTEYCVFESWKCDNQNDCLDNSDEVNCPSCSTDKFKCPDGLCLPLISRCDTLIDCYDGSDEMNCTSFHTPALCTTKEFTCKSNLKCINMRQICNQVSDCPDNSDEANCNKVACKPGEFRCMLSGNCLIKEWVCDGYEDCFDGSDEKGCKDGNLPKPLLPITLPPNLPDEQDNPFTLPPNLPDEVPNLPTTSAPSTAICDKSKCASCFTKTNGSVSASRCPSGFEIFNNKCLWIQPFPRIWLRAKDMCEMRGGELLKVPEQLPLFRIGLLSFIKQRSLEGWNYWTGKPVGSFKIQTKEADIPSWLLNGRNCSGSIYPMHAGDCYFLHHAELILYKASNCNDYAGFICEWTGHRE